MIAVILAAGMSTRLRPLTDRMPKSLLPVGGVPLLQRTLEALVAAGIRRCVIVTGYRHEMIEQFVAGLPLAIDVTYVRNERYATTGNNYSLLCAAPYVAHDDMLLLDADILFDPAILPMLITWRHADALVMKTGVALGAEEIKVELDARGHVITIGKHIPPLRAVGESIGIEKFSAATCAVLFETLARRQEKNEFYEASFQEVIDRGVRIAAVACGDLRCMEIDTPEDLEEAQQLVRVIDRKAALGAAIS